MHDLNALFFLIRLALEKNPLPAAFNTRVESSGAGARMLIAEIGKHYCGMHV
jgi:hypothetical protein